MWARALKYAERAAAVAALHYLEQRLSTQHEHKLAGECDCVETDTQRQRQQIQPTHTEVQTVDLAGDQAGAIRHDEAEERYEREGLAVMQPVQHDEAEERYEQEGLAVMHKMATSEHTAAARMRNALGGLRQQGAPPVSDRSVCQTNAIDGKVATMEDIARLLNEALDELDAQDVIFGSGALDDNSLLGRATNGTLNGKLTLVGHADKISGNPTRSSSL